MVAVKRDAVARSTKVPVSYRRKLHSKEPAVKPAAMRLTEIPTRRTTVSRAVERSQPALRRRLL